jgi:hypothetical protein
VQLAGTPSAPGNYYFTFDTASGIAALTAQVWTESYYQKLAAGTTTGITSVRPDLIEYTSGAVYIKETPGSSLLPTSSGLATQRNSSAITLSGGGTTAFVVPSVVLAMDGAAIDITLRIGMPQLELGAFATSVISTSSAAVTRAADVASITGANFTSFWNATQGTIVVRAAQPILTGGVPTLYSADSTASAFTDRVLGFLNSSTPETRVTNGGVEQATLSLTGTITAGTTVSISQAYKLNDFASVKNGGTVATDTTGTLPTVDRFEIGSIGGLNFLNGWISSLSYYQTRLPDSTLQALSA